MQSPQNQEYLRELVPPLYWLVETLIVILLITNPTDLDTNNYIHKKLSVLCRFFELTSLYGKIRKAQIIFFSFRKGLDFFFLFSKNFCYCIAPYNDTISVLQVLQSFTLFQCNLDQSMVDGGVVFPPLGQQIPDVLNITQVWSTVLHVYFSASVTPQSLHRLKT